MSESRSPEMTPVTTPKTDLPKAIWSGDFTIFGVKVRCHTLDNGQRIVDADDLAELLDAMNGPADDGVAFGDVAAFTAWRMGVGNGTCVREPSDVR